MDINSSTGTISFGQQFEVTKPHEQENTLDHLITSETLKKTYPFILKIKANVGGQTMEAQETLYSHYCVDLHTKVTEEELQAFQRDIDPQNIDQRIFFVDEQEG